MTTFDFTGWPEDGRIYCYSEGEPHLQAWGMMRAWGVTHRPEWHVQFIHDINLSVTSAFPTSV